MVVHMVIPALQRQADSWGSLTSQLCLFGEFLAIERPIIKIRQYLKNTTKDCPLAYALTWTHIHVHTLTDTHSKTHIQLRCSWKLFSKNLKHSRFQANDGHWFPLSSSRRVEFCSITSSLWIQFITTRTLPLSQTNAALVLWRVVAILRCSLCRKLCLGTFLVAWKCITAQWAGTTHWTEF